MFTVPDGATSFIKFKIKSDVVAKRTLKLVISRFCGMYEVPKKGTNFYNARAAQLLCSLDLLFHYVFFTIIVKVFLKSLIN